MAINFVRQPSETPNVRNIDDIIPFRYAYGNQNGYVKDKGNELSYTINGSNFRINSGRVVLFGVESDIDANGVTITVDNVATTRYYSVYYKVNMATNTTSIESEFSTTDYPEIDPGDDLTANTSGSANLELYRFTALNGIISNVTKIVEEIDYVNKKTKVDNASNSDKVQNVDLSGNSVATFGNYILPKKKLLWSGEERTTSENPELFINKPTDLNVGDTIEIEYSIGVGGNLGHDFLKIKYVLPVDYPSYQQCFCHLYGVYSTGTFYISNLTIQENYNRLSFLRAHALGDNSDKVDIVIYSIYKIIE